VIVLILAAVATAAFFAIRSRAMPGGDARGIRGSGTVECTEVNVASESAGRITRLRVDEGDVVKEGDVIAEIDHDVLQADYDRADAAAYTASMRYADVARGARSEQVRALAASLKEALAGLDGARIAARTAREAYERPTDLKSAVDAAASQLAVARANEALARAQESEAVTGPRRQEIEAAKADLGRAEAALTGAEAELGQAERAYTERKASDTAVAGAETELAAARAGVAVAEAARDLANAPAREAKREQVVQQIAGARSGLQLADRNLARARRLSAAGAATPQELDAATTQQEQAAAVLQQAEAALADLDAGARAEERREASAGLEKAEAVATGAERGVANARHEQAIAEAAALQQRERARAAVEQARHVRGQAVARLDALVEGTRPEELAQAGARVESARAGVSGAGRAVENASQAEQDRFTARQKLETADATVQTAQARTEAARAQLDLALAGNTNEAIEAARGQIREAEAARAGAVARLDQSTIRAPRSGTVREVVLREGEMVTPGSVVVRILDLDHLWVRIYLPVPDFGKVVVGQQARITSDAYPDQPHLGAVLTVSDEAEFTPKNTQTVEERVKQVFWVKVDAGNGGGLLKPGMPVDVVLDRGAGA
jgi:HlyD family secretion protein